MNTGVYLALSFILAWVLGLPAFEARRIGTVSANVESSSVEFPISIYFQIKEFKLENGLRVIISEDHRAPTYSLAVTYDVGSRNERPGRAGFAHLFEHLMFEGSENIGKGEYYVIADNNGGQTGGGTTQDRTNYYEWFPANQLDLGLFLEAERMRSPVINQANLENQRKAVQEEKRLNYDNRAYGRTDEAILNTAFDNFAYKHSTIGSMEDLDAATLSDVQGFFYDYYSPNNAVLTLVGDVDSEEALAKIKKYFGNIPARPSPPPLDVAEPEQKAERRKIVSDSFAPAPRLDIAYKIPPANTSDHYALSVLSSVLSSGRSSRLYQKLVKEEQMATGVFAAAEARRGPTLFSVSVDMQSGKAPSEIERMIYDELNRLKNEPVADWELEKTNQRLRSNRAQTLQGTLQRALTIGRYAVEFNDPNLINTYEQKYRNVTKEDLQRVARTYFIETNRTVITTVPKKKEASVLDSKETPNELSSADQNDKSSVRPERKDRAPVSNHLLKLKLPEPIETKLENGLTILILEDHDFPVVNVQLNIGAAGSIFEPSELPGLSSITAQMLREGTKTRNSRQIAEATDPLGATITASSNYGSTDVTLRASGLSDNFDEWFTILRDILLNPSFPKEELAKLKTRIKYQLKEQRTDPSFLADERLKSGLYGRHPASVVTTTSEALDRLTSEKLAEWHRTRFTPQNSILVISGDVRATLVIPKLKRAFEGWRRTHLKAILPPNPKPPSSRRIFLVDRPGSVQATIIIGSITIDRRSPDFVPFVVTDAIVGAGDSSRLFLNLREDKGYTYGAYSELITQGYVGTWSVSGDFRSEVTQGAITEFFRELKRIRNERVPQSELEEKKRSLVARFALSLESSSQLLNYALLRKAYDFTNTYWDTYPAKIMKVTAEDVQSIALRYINTDKMQIVVVGDAVKIKSALQRFGPVDVYTMEGKPVISSFDKVKHRRELLMR